MIDYHKTLAEKLLRKGFWLYLFSFLIAPIGYIIKIMISQDLTVEEIGIIYGVISLITLIGAFNDFGMTESLKYYIPKYIVKNEYNKVKAIITYAFGTQVISSLIIMVIIFILSPYLANNYFHSPDAIYTIKVFCLFFLGINIFMSLNTFFLAVQNTIYAKGTEFARMIFILIFVSIIFFTDLELSKFYAYSWAWIVGLYFGIIISLYIFLKKYYLPYLSREKLIWDKELYLKLFRYAIIVLLGAEASNILSQLDMQMIIYMLGAEGAGYYTNYLSIISIPFMLLGPVFMILFPIISELSAKLETNKISLVKNILVKNFIIFSLTFSSLFFIFGEVISYIFFGEKFFISGEIVKYSALFLLFNFLLQINFGILAGIGKPKERLKIVSSAIIINFILNYILIKNIGIYGAALATGIGWMYIWILSEIITRKNGFKIKIDILFFIKNILSVFLLGIFGYYIILPYFDGIDRLFSLGLLIIIGIIYFTIILLINKEDLIYFLNQVKALKK